jgi:hypothetical protein
VGKTTQTQKLTSIHEKKMLRFIVLVHALELPLAEKYPFFNPGKSPD